MQVNFQGKMVNAIPMDFFTRKEDFNEYQMSDGKTIRVKFVVTRIMKLEGQKNPDGSDVYQVQHSAVFAPVD